ncbi:MAG: CaiB/BaiF CoA transferase family protein [Lautropia sp.]
MRSDSADGTGSAGTAGTERPAPLSGVRILDFTAVLAGPYSTYQLALLGADVIKVERPDVGDWARQGATAAAVPEFSSQFVAQNADKRSVAVDLQSPDGLNAALTLAATCDVVVENFTPGTADRLGIGFDAIRARKADIVYCSISGYGQDGEMSRRPAYDHVIQAASGIAMITGTPDTVPNRIGPPMVDYLAGIYGAFSVLAALRERDRTGQAQYVDVSMLDVTLVAMASTVSNLQNAGVKPRANGNTAASGSPMSGIFPTSDGLLAIAANNDDQVERAMSVLDLADRLRERRFSTAAARLHHVMALRELLVRRLATRAAHEWESRLSDAHVPAARVRTLEDVLSEPQVATRGVQQAVVDRDTGATLWVPSIGFKWNGLSLGPRSGPPRLGEHTSQVLDELGGR